MSSSSSVISPSAPPNGTSAGADRSPDAARVVRTLGWLGVLRLGLVQTALGAIVVLTTSTINRVMVVELALPALLPGLLVGLHYAVQVTRPHMGHGSDRGGRRTPWIVGGMAVLAAGGALAAFATALTATAPAIGIPLAVLAFVLVGLGVGCSGTSLLVLLAKSVTPRFRGAAATTVWVMMIIGFIVTSIVAGAKLDPFSYGRLVDVTASVSLIAFLVTCVAVYGVERRVTGGGVANVVAGDPATPTDVETPSAVGTSDARGRSLHSGDGPAESSDLANERGSGFRHAIAEVWSEPEARRFSVFVFVSMLAYSAQDLILEPFAGAVFGMTPGESTQLAGAHSGGVLAGMLLVALCTSLGSRLGGRFGRGRRIAASSVAPGTRVSPAVLASLRFWTVAGCAASAVALGALAVGGLLAGAGLAFPLRAGVFALGLANGAFAVAAIGSMMDLVGRGAKRREGVRMGLWGAAQAIAFGLGGVLATSAVDLSSLVAGNVATAYALVFALQGLLFVLAARLARGVYRPAAPEGIGPLPVGRMALETQS